MRGRFHLCLFGSATAVVTLLGASAFATEIAAAGAMPPSAAAADRIPASAALSEPAKSASTAAKPAVIAAAPVQTAPNPVHDLAASAAVAAPHPAMASVPAVPALAKPGAPVPGMSVPGMSVPGTPTSAAPGSAYASRLDLLATGAVAEKPEIGPAAVMPMPAHVAPVSPPPAANALDKPRKDAEDKGLDPEPDVAIKPPPVTPPADPLLAPPKKPLDAAASGADEPLPILNAAIKRALDRRDAIEIKGAAAMERRHEREAIAFFYAAHSFAPVWTAEAGPVPAVESVLARLAHARDDALSIPAVPAMVKATGTPDEIAESEIALSEAVVSYARQASGSRIDPRSIAPLIGFRPDLADAAEALETVAAASADAGDRLRAFNPSEPRYAALREKLAELRDAHTPEAAAPIPAGPELRVGMSDPRVPLIRARFSLDGTPDGAPQDMRYDTEVAGAIAGFQKANGLPASGVLTKRTIAALSGGQPSRLEGELVANMEMWRWMPRDLGADRIEVNVPDFDVTVYQNGLASSTNRVVVGKTSTPTPLFSNTMKFLIVNPVWNVPDSIVKKEMLPKLAGDPGYLDRLGYSVSESHGRLVVRQPAGAKNALGRIKFMFPNDYAVYLHDTPSKSLFTSAHRAFSHGCVRVDQPFRFAESVLGPDKGWSEQRLKNMLGSSERYVYLPKPLPIHIEYFTAAVDETGHLNLRDDVYDYTRKVAVALGQEG